MPEFIPTLVAIIQLQINTEPSYGQSGKGKAKLRFLEQNRYSIPADSYLFSTKILW